MLGVMAAPDSKRPPTGPASAGSAIAARRRYLGLEQTDIVALTNGVINLKLLSQLENDHKHPSTLRLGKYRALLEVLQWSPAAFEAETGVPPMTSEPLPGGEPFTPSVQVPNAGALSAGLKEGVRMLKDIVKSSRDWVPIDPSIPQLRGVRHDALVALTVDGASLVSEAAARYVRAGGVAVVELNALAADGALVAWWVPRFNVSLLAEEGESASAIVRSVDGHGPVFRLGDESRERRGVVRLVQMYP
jgi:hypothetical protein